METIVSRRDYSLTGTEAPRAVERGLTDGQWYKAPVERSEMLSLMSRTNGRAARDLILWLALLVGSGTWLVLSWLSWWTIPAAFVYGTLYGSSCDARWHECGHRTAFASKRINDIVYYVASFMALREPISWRWSHARHHSETIIVGRDPEIAFPRPIERWKIAAEFFALISGYKEFIKYATNVAGRLTPDVATYLPPRETQRSIRWGRIHAFLWVTVIAISVASSSLLPLMVVGLPSFYGRWLMMLTGITQHAGLGEDTLDHRQNTRTVMMNPVIRFLYLNMNYHLEHHMFPAVPYHRLPDLHRLVAADLPTPTPSIAAALREVLPALKKIRADYR